MPIETKEAATSQQAPAKADTSDANKSGNVNLGQATNALLKREAALTAKIKAPAESVAAADKTAPENPASTSATDATDKTAPEPKTNDAKADAKADADKSDDALSKISPEIQAAIDKRIGKALEKARLAEEKAAALERQLATKALPDPVVQVTPDNPLANVNDVESLKKELKSAKETKLWAQQQLNRKDIGNGLKVGDTTYTEDQFRDALNNIERRIEIEIPERAEFLQKRAQFNELAAKNFDWLADPTSGHFALYRRFLASNPVIAAMPNASYLAAAAVEGQGQVALREAIAEGNRGTKPAKSFPQAPASQLAGGVAVSSGSREAGNGRAQKALADEMGKLKKSGHVTVRDAAAFFRQKETTR